MMWELSQKHKSHITSFWTGLASCSREHSGLYESFIALCSHRLNKRVEELVNVV